MWTFGIWKADSTGKELFFKVLFNMAFANNTLNLLHIRWFCRNPLCSVSPVIRQTKGQSGHSQKGGGMKRDRKSIWKPVVFYKEISVNFQFPAFECLHTSSSEMILCYKMFYTEIFRKSCGQGYFPSCASHKVWRTVTFTNLLTWIYFKMSFGWQLSFGQ